MKEPTRADAPRILLRELEQRARRRFGQHFLTDSAVVDRMVRGARVSPGDRVVEIGPGLGILTNALIRAGVDLTAVEIDRDLAAFIRARYPDVHLIEADALKVDWDELCPGAGWKVVANLPYNVGTTVLMNLLRRSWTFQSVTVMLQLEVVNRLMAGPGTKTYGALSVQAQALGAPVFLQKLRPGAFHPPPKVESAVVRFDLYDTPRVGAATPAIFDRVVRAAFAHRRKTLSNSLKSAWPKEQVALALEAAEVAPGARGEALGMASFVRLAEAFHALK